VGQIKGSFSSHTQLYVLLNEYQNPSRASNTLVIFYTVRSNRYDNKYCPHGNGHIAMCLWLLGTMMRNAPPNRQWEASIASRYTVCYCRNDRSTSSTNSIIVATRKSRRIEVAGCFAPKLRAPSNGINAIRNCKKDCHIELLIDDIFRVLLRCNDVSVVVLQQHNHWMNPSNGSARQRAWLGIGMRMLDLRADPQR
jgi:hypothetical protein